MSFVTFVEGGGVFIVLVCVERAETNVDGFVEWNSSNQLQDEANLM